ncbi:hypothetical protein [Bifidobacterium breve]|uniref:Uncharacterized protein n=1 Tax=Bifidobacterium breve TaxID=1685 RepID=A0A2K9BDH4_BIFBR|nr:hypothetical protein [Bifidobacterium breve]AUE03071.1 hypothetical protein BB215W447A_1053 [Bifidobacterium breve]
MKTASFHTTARKTILATLQANRDDLRVRDTREWRFLTDEEFRRLGHAKPSDVSYAGDLDDYGMFDGSWRNESRNAYGDNAEALKKYAEGVRQ